MLVEAIFAFVGLSFFGVAAVIAVVKGRNNH
jgi:hypothetical protein